MADNSNIDNSELSKQEVLDLVNRAEGTIRFELLIPNQDHTFVFELIETFTNLSNRTLGYDPVDPEIVNKLGNAALKLYRYLSGKMVGSGHGGKVLTFNDSVLTQIFTHEGYPLIEDWILKYTTLYLEFIEREFYIKIYSQITEENEILIINKSELTRKHIKTSLDTQKERFKP